MLTIQVFAGPISESVPSSITGFAHKRTRADSVASFTYFQDEDESPEWSEDQAIMDEGEHDDLEIGKPSEHDLELDSASRSTSLERRKSSGFSVISAKHPLLHRHDSTRTDLSAFNHVQRSTQKIYVVTEDLTIVVAGFSTNTINFLLYIAICVLSFGLGYLLLRWLPRLYVRVVGTSKPLRDCDWVVIEVRPTSRRCRSRNATKVNQNQWGEFTVHQIAKVSYGHAVSTVFGSKGKEGYNYDYDENDDPVMMHLRFLDYRYIRFCFHPLRNKFVLCSDWKDPNWTDVRSIRAGLDSDERHRRHLVFGSNQIDIQQKSILQLLIDEVGLDAMPSCSFCSNQL